MGLPSTTVQHHDCGPIPAEPGAEAHAHPRVEQAGQRRRPLAGQPGSRDGGQVIVDIDATLVRAHSDKEGAEPTYKRGYGFPRCARSSTTASTAPGRRWLVELRRGRASAFDVADPHGRAGPSTGATARGRTGQVLVRTDSGGCSKAFLHRHHVIWGWSTRSGSPRWRPSRPLWTPLPAQAWRAALDSDGEPREGAQVAELTAWLPDTRARDPARPSDLAGRDAGHRPPRDFPIPGAQLRLTDEDGWRITCFATNTRRPRLDTAGTGGSTPPTRPGRGPDPRAERHRPA